MICTLCPRQCGATRTENTAGGFCNQPALPVVARAALHFGEEPCISGTRGSGTVFFSGCNLRCCFCQNEVISHGGAGRPVTAARLREIFSELEALGAHNINLVTGTHFIPAIAEALEHSPSVPVVWNSSGYESVDALRLLEGKVQIYLPDFKYADPALAQRLSGAADYPDRAAEALSEMLRQTGPCVLTEDGLLRRGVLVRHLLLPGKLENTKAVIDRVREICPPEDILFSLMSQYVPLGRALTMPDMARRIRKSEYRAAAAYLEACGFTNGYLQEPDAATTEMIPAFDLTGV